MKLLKIISQCEQVKRIKNCEWIMQYRLTEPRSLHCLHILFCSRIIKHFIRSLLLLSLLLAFSIECEMLEVPSCLLHYHWSEHFCANFSNISFERLRLAKVHLPSNPSVGYKWLLSEYMCVNVLLQVTRPDLLLLPSM